MQKAEAVFRNGRVEFDAPVAWPDGTKLEVSPKVVAKSNDVDPVDRAAALLDLLMNPDPDQWGLEESQWPQAPEEVEAWLQWCDSREPVMSAEEQEQFQADLAASRTLQKSLVQANWDRQEALF